MFKVDNKDVDKVFWLINKPTKLERLLAIIRVCAKQLAISQKIKHCVAEERFLLLNLTHPVGNKYNLFCQHKITRILYP